MTKKLLVPSLAAILMAALAGCGGNRYQGIPTGGSVMYKLDTETGDVWLVRLAEMEKVRDVTGVEKDPVAAPKASPFGELPAYDNK